ncbi:MAG: chloride channel protein [Gemmatimonadetes bacterium]|nr:chloride channel protein [Gemmatimonadota bacterium]
MINRAIKLLRDLHDGLRRTEQVYMVLVAVVIGLLGGLCAVGFRRLIQILNRVAWHESQYTIEYLYSLPIWWKILAPATGGLIVGLITYRFAREARGHGVPEVMEAVALRGGRIRPRVVVAKMLASSVSIASGGSVGREGPIVQIGAALGSTLGQWLKVDQRRLRTLVGCGAAAGIAATFNAPVAGALFAVEIILGDFGVSQFSPIVISSVMGTVVSQYFLGDFPAFAVPAYSLVHAFELVAYAALGLLAGLAALAFTRTLYAAEDLFDKVRIYPPARTMIGGAMIGIIGVWLPQVFGVGYETINDALQGAMVWKFMLLLVVFKIVAVSITIGSGGSGGIFAPSLFIGAMLGGAVGTVVHTIWPASTAGAGAYALVGMGAVVAAGTHAPITAILIIFELTGDYKIILPLMISCITATLLATQMQTASIYTLKLLRRGIDIHKGKDVNVLQSVHVREEMRSDAVVVSPEAPLVALLSKFIEHPGSTLFVTDDDNHLLGIVTSDDIRPLMRDAASLETLVIAEDVMTAQDFPTVSPDDSLAHVMKFLGSYRGEVAVLERGRLVGVIWPEDVIQRYNTEIFKRDMARSMVSAVNGESAVVTAVEDTAVTEIPVPAQFIGKSIRELDIRKNFGVSVLMVKQSTADGQEELQTTPSADYTFRQDDVMLVMGPNEELRRLKKGR